VLIDWFTVIAQLINFLILVYLLQRFLYKPIVKTIADRDRQIEQQWNEAHRSREVADREAKSYR
jgi:F-type H+-transporting ATPase subunit b